MNPKIAYSDVAFNQNAVGEENIIELCRRAQAFENAGNYEAARHAMSNLWNRVGEHPRLDDLTRRGRAEVLLRVGALTGWMGSANQIEGAQETAKNLLSESAQIFEEIGCSIEAAEALADLAYCYWREGAFDEARVMLANVRARLDNESGEAATNLRVLACVRGAIVERAATRFYDAFDLLREATPLIEQSTNDSLKGRFHNELAILLELLGAAERREDLIDRALIEYTAASVHFEAIGHTRYRAAIENNIGFLLFTTGKFPEAHEHLNRARAIWINLKDTVRTAQADETRARLYVAQGNYEEAFKVVSPAVQIFEQAGETALLAEALTTLGTSQARLGYHAAARLTLERVIETSELAGNIESAGLAAITLLEELDEQFDADERRALYLRADGLLAGTQHPGILARLRQCASRTLGEFSTSPQAIAPATSSDNVANSKPDSYTVLREISDQYINKEFSRYYGKAVAFTPGTIEKLHTMLLDTKTRSLDCVIEETFAAAEEIAVISDDAVEIVKLRGTQVANFAEPWKEFSLKEEVRIYEEKFIELALKEAKGMVSHAARLLGYKHHESFNWRLKNRNKGLLSARTPIKKRRRSIIRKDA